MSMSPPMFLSLALIVGLAAPGAALAGAHAASAHAAPVDGASASAPTLPWTLVATQPHDARVFTEGLAMGPDGLLYESAGLYGASGVLKAEPVSGQIIATHPLMPKYFGEGLTFMSGSLYQLTWQEKTLFRWTPDLEPAQAMPFPWEGWGLTTYQGQLVASDGTEKLRFFTPTGLGPAAVREITVTDGGLPVEQLNELEAVPASAPSVLAGKILANVWHARRVAVIDPGERARDGLAGSLRPGEDPAEGHARQPGGRRQRAGMGHQGQPSGGHREALAEAVRAPRR